MTSIIEHGYFSVPTVEVSSMTQQTSCVTLSSMNNAVKTAACNVATLAV